MSDVPSGEADGEFAHVSAEFISAAADPVIPLATAPHQENSYSRGVLGCCGGVDASKQRSRAIVAVSIFWVLSSIVATLSGVAIVLTRVPETLIYFGAPFISGVIGIFAGCIILLEPCHGTKVPNSRRTAGLLKRGWVGIAISAGSMAAFDIALISIFQTWQLLVACIPVHGHVISGAVSIAMLIPIQRAMLAAQPNSLPV